MYKAIEQKDVTLYPGILPTVIGIEIAHLAPSQHPLCMLKNSNTTFCEH